MWEGLCAPMSKRAVTDSGHKGRSHIRCYFTNFAKIWFASSSVSLLPMSYHDPLI